MISNIQNILFRLAAGLTIATIAQAGNSAHAAQATGTIDIDLNMTNACAVNGATRFSNSFGNTCKILFAHQLGLLGDVDGQLVGSLGNLTVQCSPGVAPTLTVGTGANDQGSNRRMKSGSTTVAYHLYTTSARQDEITVGQQIAPSTHCGVASGYPARRPIFRHRSITLAW